MKNRFFPAVLTIIMALFTIMFVRTPAVAYEDVVDTVQIECLEHVPAEASVTVDVRIWTDTSLCGFTIPLIFYNPLNTDIVCDSVSFSDTFWAYKPTLYGGDVFPADKKVQIYSAYFSGNWPIGDNLVATLYFTTGADWDTTIGIKIDTTLIPPTNTMELVGCVPAEVQPIEFVYGCLGTGGLDNLPPELNLPLDLDTSLAFGSTLCLKYITATDPNPDDTLILEMLSGPGTFESEIGLSPLTDSICFEPGDVDSTYEFVFKVTDPWGETDQDTFYVNFTTTDVPETHLTGVAGFVLAQNYPNPFNLKTSMNFEIPYECRVSLKIYNLAGRLVNTLVDRKMEKGQHTVFWDGTSSAGDPVASGIYFYKLTASDFVSVKKMILLK